MSTQITADPQYIEFLKGELQATIPVMEAQMDENREIIDEARKKIVQIEEEAIQEEADAAEAEKTAEENYETAVRDLDDANIALSDAEQSLLDIINEPEPDNGNESGAFSGACAGKSYRVTAAQLVVDAARNRVAECERKEKERAQELEKAVDDHEKTIDWLEDVQKRQAEFEEQAAAYEKAASEMHDYYVYEINDYIGKLDDYKNALLKSRGYLSGVYNVEPPPPPPPLRGYPSGVYNENIEPTWMENPSGAMHNSILPPPLPPLPTTQNVEENRRLTPLEIAAMRRRLGRCR